MVSCAWWRFAVGSGSEVDGRGGATGEVVGNERGVAADAVDEVRVAVVLEALTEDVQAVDGGDAAVLADLAAGVEHGDVQPRVAAAVARRPDDRGDASGA